MKLERTYLPIFALLATTSCSGTAHELDEVVVFAASSFTDVVNDLADHPALARLGFRIRTNVAGSQQLALQLEHGANAQVFLSADERWTDYLIKHEVAHGKHLLATNTLTVITTKKLVTLHDLGNPGLRIVTGSENVPVGAYTGDVLRRMASDESYGEAFVERVKQNIVSHEENVRAVLAKVLLGEADAGFVYRTDVRNIHNTDLRIIPIPDHVNVTAGAYASLVTPNGHRTHAESFLNFLTSPDTRAILRAHGFSVP